MAIKNTFLILELGKNGGKHSFFSESEISEWFTKELSFNSWLNDTQSQHPNVQGIAQQVFSHFSTLQNNLNQSLQSVDQAQKSANLNSLKINTESFYINELLIHSSTPAAKFINKLKEKNPVIAAHALGYLSNITGNPSYWNHLSINGFNEAWAFKNGVKSSEDERENLDSLRIEMQNLLDQGNVDRKDLNISFEEIKKNIEEVSISHTTQHLENILDNQAKLDQFILDSNVRLSNIADAYDKHMALQASVDYWSDRARYHKSEGAKYLKLTGGVAVIGLITILIVSFILLYLSTPNVENKFMFLSFNNIPVWQISIIVFTISIFIWAGRILVRLLLSNLHLETDAGERVVMAKTYIAMLREGQAPKDDDRKLILASLFRPNITGIINDDAMPFNLDAMQKLIGGKN